MVICLKELHAKTGGKKPEFVEVMLGSEKILGDAPMLRTGAKAGKEIDVEASAARPDAQRTDRSPTLMAAPHLPLASSRAPGRWP